MLEQRYSAADKDCRHPPPPVDTFLEKNAGSDGIGTTKVSDPAAGATRLTSA